MLDVFGEWAHHVPRPHIAKSLPTLKELQGLIATAWIESTLFASLERDDTQIMETIKAIFQEVAVDNVDFY
jgi:hypothetical protein